MVAAVVSGGPSTLAALATRRDPLEATVAAGSILLPHENRRGLLLAAAVPTHLAISGLWGMVLGTVFRRRRSVAVGAAAGVVIAVVDLVAIGARFPRVRALPLIPQLADHIAFGVTVALLLPPAD
jgi:hypothetical protein